ncbi:hypothetical protein BCR39DRAFT_140063 [Naematelia encephala]|uniref:Uncharacterized protein n=1 Tax=Naematelia encephala TaxID=71784 RepID=A0A1Y2BJM0_9TREE|nr:hypothetical protein BCR39DRAFT_140063 [Naematelia encephala]
MFPRQSYPSALCICYSALFSCQISSTEGNVWRGHKENKLGYLEVWLNISWENVLDLSAVVFVENLQKV